MEGNSNDLFVFEPYGKECAINDTITVTTISQEDVTEIHEDEFEFKDVTDAAPNPPEGPESNYDCGEIGNDEPEEEVYDFGEEPEAPNEFTSSFDNEITNRTYNVTLRDVRNMYGCGAKITKFNIRLNNE